MVIKIIGRIQLSYTQIVQNHNTVRQRKCFFLVMSYINHCDLQFLLDVLQLLPQNYLDFRIQSRHRLIKQNNVRVQHQSSGNRHTLLLAAGELLRFFIDMLFQTDCLDDLPHLLIDLLFPIF